MGEGKQQQLHQKLVAEEDTADAVLPTASECTSESFNKLIKFILSLVGSSATDFCFFHFPSATKETQQPLFSIIKRERARPGKIYIYQEQLIVHLCVGGMRRIFALACDRRHPAISPKGYQTPHRDALGQGI